METIIREGYHFFRIADNGNINQIPVVLVMDVAEKKVVLTAEWDLNYKEKIQLTAEEYRQELRNFDKISEKLSHANFQNAVNSNLVARNEALIVES